MTRYFVNSRLITARLSRSLNRSFTLPHSRMREHMYEKGGVGGRKLDTLQQFTTMERFSGKKNATAACRGKRELSVRRVQETVCVHPI